MRSAGLVHGLAYFFPDGYLARVPVTGGQLQILAKVEGSRVQVLGDRLYLEVGGSLYVAPALVDHARVRLASLDVADPRSFDVSVAGVAALMVSKLHKIAERKDAPTRLQDKDACWPRWLGSRLSNCARTQGAPRINEKSRPGRPTRLPVDLPGGHSLSRDLALRHGAPRSATTDGLCFPGRRRIWPRIILSAFSQPPILSNGKKGVRKMRIVGSVIILLMLTSSSLAKKSERREKKSGPVRTINTLRTKGKSISFMCSPSNCKEQQDGSLLFNLTCQTNKEGDKLEIYMGDKSQTIQSYGFVDIPGQIKAPKKGSVPIKISVSEDEDSPRTTFTFKYTAEQIRRPTCRRYGEVEL
ncbi:MAG: hypothetical protein ABSB49_06380 [Polyangia bacterium]|jgi:hypothetical protein